MPQNLYMSKLRNVGCVKFCGQFELELASSSISSKMVHLLL